LSFGRKCERRLFVLEKLIPFSVRGVESN
jgi:hypothetical protein